MGRTPALDLQGQGEPELLAGSQPADEPLGELLGLISMGGGFGGQVCTHTLLEHSRRTQPGCWVLMRPSRSQLGVERGVSWHGLVPWTKETVPP